MNQSAKELAALQRIIRAVKQFRQLVADAKTTDVESQDAYLKQHLSAQDWLFWKQLQTDSEEIPVAEPEPLVDQALSRHQFKHLLGQYKRAGFELYQVWYQAHQSSICDPTDPFQ